MSHQAHNIPWTILTSHLTWRQHCACKHGATDLHWRCKPNQGKELTYFVRAFTATLHEHTDCERRKYPATFDPPAKDDTVISDETCRNIITTVRHFRSRGGSRYNKYDPKSTLIICPHDGAPCSCALPSTERKMEAFMRKKEHNDCYHFHEVNSDAFLNVEIFKTLLMHGEMETLLRVYSQPEHSLAEWWEAYPCYDVSEPLGWKPLCEKALRAYLLLNILYLFPETWQGGHAESKDYRNTRVYQATVCFLAKNWGYSDVASYPHRQFFNIADDGFYHYSNASLLETSWDDDFNVSGALSHAQFLKVGKSTGYTPTAEDSQDVRHVLLHKGLPYELVDQILLAANYGHRTRRLPIDHDPFHTDNRAELGKYLKYCWVMLVRCELISRTIGMWIDWEQVVARQLVTMLDCSLIGEKHRSCRINQETERVIFV